MTCTLVDWLLLPEGVTVDDVHVVGLLYPVDPATMHRDAGTLLPSYLQVRATVVADAPGVRWEMDLPTRLTPSGARWKLIVRLGRLDYRLGPVDVDAFEGQVLLREIESREAGPLDEIRPLLYFGETEPAGGQAGDRWIQSTVRQLSPSGEWVDVEP